MKLTLEQQEVKRLYIEGKTAAEIIKKTGISKSKVYRWLKDESLDFETSKKLANFNARAVAGVLDESHKKLLLEISEDPKKLLDPKVADALLKTSKVLESLGQRNDREKAENEKAMEVKGVLIIDDVEYEYLIKKKAEENITTVDS